MWVNMFLRDFVRYVLGVVWSGIIGCLGFASLHLQHSMHDRY